MCVSENLDTLRNDGSRLGLAGVFSPLFRPTNRLKLLVKNGKNLQSPVFRQRAYNKIHYLDIQTYSIYNIFILCGSFLLIFYMICSVLYTIILLGKVMEMK